MSYSHVPTRPTRHPAFLSFTLLERARILQALTQKGVTQVSASGPQLVDLLCVVRELVRNHLLVYVAQRVERTELGVIASTLIHPFDEDQAFTRLRKECVASYAKKDNPVVGVYEFLDDLSLIAFEAELVLVPKHPL